MSSSFVDWYNSGGKTKLSRKRKKRYKTDPKYRNTVKRRATKYYEDNKGLPVDRKVFKSKGSNFYSIGKVATVINRNIQTIRTYHTNGIIPKTTHTDPRGWRLYTEHQINLLKRVFSVYDSKSNEELKKLHQVKEILEKEWDNE